MLEFAKIAYITTTPFLLAVSITGPAAYRKHSINLLAVTNLVLICNSIFVIQQLNAVYQLGRSLGVSYRPWGETSYWFLIRLMLMVLLPVLSLHRFFRVNRWFSLALVVLLYSFYPLHTWNNYGLLYKIIAYLCLLCSVYALLWLLKKLPYQSY